VPSGMLAHSIRDLYCQNSDLPQPTCSSHPTFRTANCRALLGTLSTSSDVYERFD